MKATKTRIPAIVETEVRSLRAAKAHNTRWLNNARRQVDRVSAAIDTFTALITKGDSSDMTWVSLAQAREAQEDADRRVLRVQQNIIKIDDRIAELIEYGVQYEQRRAAEGGN
jgi:hypothetical protein